MVDSNQIESPNDFQEFFHVFGYMSIKGALSRLKFFSDKAPRKKTDLCKISFSSDIWFPCSVKLKFRWCLNTTCYRLKINEPLFTIFCCNNSRKSVICYFKKC